MLNSDLAVETRSAPLSQEQQQEDFFAASSTASSDSEISQTAQTSSASKAVGPKLSGMSKTIYQALDVVPTSIDALVNRTGLSVAEIAQQLMLMELKGQIAQTPGGYVRL